MEDLKNKQALLPISVRSQDREKFWKFLTVTFIFLTIFLVFIIVLKGSPQQTSISNKNEPNLPSPTTTENSLYFSYQNLDQHFSGYEYTLLASPEILKEQKDNTWKSMECIYSTDDKSSYTIDEINKHIFDETLLNGLQNIEEYNFKTTIKNEDGSISKEYTSLQNISYTDICKDSENFYILFLTTGEKNKAQSLLPIESVKAAGGWLGHSNFAIIPFLGEVRIYENINGFSKNIAVNDILKSGFGSATSRSFAYYSCDSFTNKLGENLYVFCGGEGGSGLFKLSLNPITFTEIAFCWWYQQDSWVCYDSQGQRYSQYY